MEDIWSRWEKHYLGLGIKPKRICKDGIMSKFDSGEPKILFIMKDVNDLEGENLPEWLKDGPKYPLWHTIAKWSAGIFNDFPPYRQIDAKIMKESLEKIAAINLKKASGKSSVDPEIINAYTHQDRELLLEQIGSIAPDFIISCGIMDQLIWLLDLKVNPEKPSSEPVKDTARNAWIIPFRHPARASGDKIYKELKEIFTKVQKLD